MASSLSRRHSARLLRSSLSPVSAFSRRLMPQIPSLDSISNFPCSSDEQAIFRAFSVQKIAGPNRNFSAFIASCSYRASFCSAHSLCEERSISSNCSFKSDAPNLSRENPWDSVCSDIPSSSILAKYKHEGWRRNPRLNFIRCYSGSVVDPKYEILVKPTKHYPSFIKLYSNSTQVPTAETQGNRDQNPVNSRTDGSSSENPDDRSRMSEFQHQEIVGPTVVRDISALAEETRQVLQNLKKTMYELSKVVALLGLVQLSCGAWISYRAGSPLLSEASIQGFFAFAFPFSLAFLLRQTLKPMIFFGKMEDQGRLQILTLTLQVSKSLNLFFLRARVISFSCIVAMLIGLLSATWPK